LRTSLCPQTIQPNRPQQLPEEQEQHGSGIADQSAKTKSKKIQKKFKTIITKTNHNIQQEIESDLTITLKS
jgi:hypothetical protein